MRPSPVETMTDHAEIRLAALSPLGDADRAALRAAAQLRTAVAARRDLAKAGAAMPPTILLAGWACLARDLRDGRRQILDFVLPGELIGTARRGGPRIASYVSSLTAIATCPAPEAPPGSGLADAYAADARHREVALLRQITRLGRMNALERTADLLLDLHERLMLAGAAGPDGFALPITQETMADALGLTSVHVNRTLKMMRRDGMLAITGGTVSLSARERLRDLVS